jgi:hypothetical protein
MATTHKSNSSHSSSHNLSTEDRKKLDDSKYAFPDERKEPLEDASHVRNAIARFDQVKGVSDEEREKAFHRIKAAAKKFGVDMPETDWKQLGKHPHTANSAHK